MRVAVALAVTLAAAPAHATYSIVATDARSREVGGAGASCIGTLSARVIYGSVPGKGAVHAQAQLGGPGKATAVAQLEMGIDPAAIVAAITSPQVDGNAQVRQYGVVDLQGRVAGFTGAQTLAFADDRQGQIATFTYAVQGNILTSAAVLDRAAAAFEAGGCDLADRLVRALEAGAANGEGDSRCTRDGIPSDSAFLQVDRESGTLLRIEVTDTAPESPLIALRAEYDAWRVTHPCPAAPSADVGDDAHVDTGCGCTGADPGGAWWVAIVTALIARIRPRRRRTAGARS